MLRLSLPLPFPGLDRVNAYLLRDDDGDTLVDCGIYFPDDEHAHGWDDLVTALQAPDSAPGNVRRLVVTHPHIDHYGMAGRLVEEVGCELWMHAASTDDLELYRDPEGVAAGLRKMFADHGVEPEVLDELTAYEDWRPFVSAIVEPTTPVRDGDEFACGGRTWTVIHTPGHSHAHICLFEPQSRTLMSGDHLLGSITPHIDFKRGEDEDPLGDFLRSLNKVEELEPALVLPGHGRPFEDGAERARAIQRHHDRRLGSILQVIRKAPHTASEITDEIFTGELLNFQRRLALGEALAHLAYLRRNGEIERLKQDGTFVYQKVSRRRVEADE